VATPKFKCDKELVENLASIGATTAEIAAMLKCSARSLQRHCKPQMERGRENAKFSLRRMQWIAAKAGNPAMLVWLGKQILGQKDRHEHSGDADAPLVIRRMDYSKKKAEPKK